MGLYGRSVKALFFDEYVDDHAPKWPDNWHPSPIKRVNVLFILEQLNKIMPHSNWFISGSVANPEVYFKHCSDIDIFFYSTEDYDTANAVISARSDSLLVRTSGSAETYNIKGIGLAVQLIKKHVGSITQVFNTFDLNIAKYAVRSDGQQIADVCDTDLIQVVNPNSASVSRVAKYMEYLRYDSSRKNEAWKRLIDDHMGNDSIVEDYYDPEGNKLLNKPFNKLLYNKIKYTRSLKPYLDEKALEHAPELLI